MNGICSAIYFSWECLLWKYYSSEVSPRRTRCYCLYPNHTISSPKDSHGIISSNSEALTSAMVVPISRCISSGVQSTLSSPGGLIRSVEQKVEIRSQCPIYYLHTKLSNIFTYFHCLRFTDSYTTSTTQDSSASPDPLQDPNRWPSKIHSFRNQDCYLKRYRGRPQDEHTVKH